MTTKDVQFPIRITADQRAFLDEESARRGVTRGELIRRYIDTGIKRVGWEPRKVGRGRTRSRTGT